MYTVVRSVVGVVSTAVVVGLLTVGGSGEAVAQVPGVHSAKPCRMTPPKKQSAHNPRLVAGSSHPDSPLPRCADSNKKNRQGRG